jgi:hypothetical protein
MALWAGSGQDGRWRLRAGSRRARRASFFGGTWAAEGADMVMSTDRSCLRAQVLDGGRGGLTGKRARVAAPVECWGCVESACMIESYRGRA